VWSLVSNAGAWTAFLGLLLYDMLAYKRGKVISPAEHERALATERRISGFHEQRADLATARADKADAALAKLVGELPPALSALAATKAGAT
jgi:hypothetical protein